MNGPAPALNPCPRRYGPKNTQRWRTNTGPSASKASWLNIPAALPWLYTTAGNGPAPSGLNRTPFSVRFPLGNVTIADAGGLVANAAPNTIRQMAARIGTL